MSYTLQDYFTAAKLEHPVSFAQYIEMEHVPWKHQIVELNSVLTHDDWGLYSDPALGKTMVAQAYSMYWVSEGQRVLWLMPPTLLGQWYDSFHKEFQGVEKYIDIQTFSGTSAQRKKQEVSWKENGVPQVLALGYQLFTLSVWKKLQSMGYKVLVMDEAHNLKNPESKTYNLITQNFLKEGKDSAALPMTGTPVHRELKDTYTLIKMTNQKAYSSYDQFERLHCLFKRIKFKTPKRTKKGKMLRGFRHHYGYTGEKKIRAALFKNASRHIRKEVTEIKDPQIIEVPVTLDSKHLSLYKKLMRERILELDNEELVTALTAQELRQKALQIVTCPELFVPSNVVIKNNVARCVNELIDGCGIWQSKVIVFLHFRRSVEQFSKAFEQYNPALMYGGSNTEANRVKFLNDDSCRMLIANVKSAGAGFNFQHVSNTIIYPEPTAVPGDFKQSMERVVRHGQEREVNIYVLKALKTVAVKATKTMLERQTKVQEITQDKSNFLDYFKVA